MDAQIDQPTKLKDVYWSVSQQYLPMAHTVNVPVDGVPVVEVQVGDMPEPAGLGHLRPYQQQHHRRPEPAGPALP